jgi:hypothetical protein
MEEASGLLREPRGTPWSVMRGPPALSKPELTWVLEMAPAEKEESPTFLSFSSWISSSSSSSWPLRHLHPLRLQQWLSDSVEGALECRVRQHG